MYEGAYSRCLFTVIYLSRPIRRAFASCEILVKKLCKVSERRDLVLSQAGSGLRYLNYLLTIKDLN